MLQKKSCLYPLPISQTETSWRRIYLIGRYTRAARPYLFSDGQNMYNRVILVCTVNVYIHASLGRLPNVKYQVLQVRQNCTHFTFSLRTNPYVSCRKYCKQFENNNIRHLLSAVFIVRHFKYRKQKTQTFLQSETWFLSIIKRSKGLFPVGLPVKSLKALLHSSIMTTCPVHLNLLDLITLTILGERYKRPIQVIHLKFILSY